jgi:hypothetical protein
VYFGFEENGVIKAQPAVVSVRSEHLEKYTFLRLALDTFIAEYTKASVEFITSDKFKTFLGVVI